MQTDGAPTMPGTGTGNTSNLPGRHEGPFVADGTLVVGTVGYVVGFAAGSAVGTRVGDITGGLGLVAVGGAVLGAMVWT